MFILQKIILLFSVLILLLPTLCTTKQITSLYDIMKDRPDITYKKIHEQIPFHYKALPISPYNPNHQITQGIFAETFVATIPHGIICSDFGWIITDNKIVKEFITQLVPLNVQFEGLAERKLDNKPVQHLSGKIAVITTTLHPIYGHWFNDIVGRLILLQESEIEYDWLYAPKYAQFMKETYKIYGIPLEKIIDPTENLHYIQADQIIVPSMTMRRLPCHTDQVYDVYPATYYWPQWIINDIRLRFLPYTEEIIKQKKFSKKIFIGRGNATVRRSY